MGLISAGETEMVMRQCCRVRPLEQEIAERHGHGCVPAAALLPGWCACMHRTKRQARRTTLGEKPACFSRCRAISPSLQAHDFDLIAGKKWLQPPAKLQYI